MQEVIINISVLCLKVLIVHRKIKYKVDYPELC